VVAARRDRPGPAPGVLTSAVTCVAAVAAVVVAVSPARGAPSPRSVLVAAEQKTAAAQSVHVAMTTSISQAGRTLVVKASGVQETPRKAGSFVYDFSQVAPTLGETDAIVLGAKAYLHYGGLDPLRAREPKLKQWVVLDTRSALGVDPWGLGKTALATLKAVIGLRAVGTGSDAGSPVVRYAGSLDFARAVSLAPQLQQVLSHLPSSAGVVANARGRVEFWVGDDGYLHRTIESLSAPVPGQQPLRIGVTLSYGEFGVSPGAIVAPPASEVMSLAAFNRLLGGVVQSGASRKLDPILLRAPQVGAGYRRTEIPGGRLVQGEVTLDLCGARFPSEALRTARAQVVYKAAGTSLGVSNEVVGYRSGGAAQALREVTNAADHCPRGPVGSATPGVTQVTYRLQRIHDARLLPGSLALAVHASGTVNGAHRSVTQVVVYQVRGNVLSAVYAFGGSVAKMRTLALAAAAQSAANLRHG
jgi:hypothetical protein